MAPSFRPDLLCRMPGGLLEVAGPEPLPAKLAMSLAVGPGMQQRENLAQDLRLSAKEADDVLEVVRQQAYAMRRWIVSAHPSQLHGLIRIYCYVRTDRTAILRFDMQAKSRKLRPTEASSSEGSLSQSGLSKGNSKQLVFFLFC